MVQQYRLTSGNSVRFSAKTLSIRREHTGIHATVRIAMNHVALAYSTFNIERDEDRVRLANSAFKALGKDAELDTAEWPNAHMKKGLDLFCDGLWGENVSANKGELMAGDPDLGPVSLLLGGYVVEGGGTILFAPPGRGKSYTGMAMAVSMHQGLDVLWPVERKSVLYINLERSRTSMQRRLTAVNLALGLDARTPLPFLNARGQTLTDIIEAAHETAKDYSCQVVILDSISRAGVKLGEDDPVNKIMDAMNRNFDTWVSLAHSPRADESHVFGSQMFDAAADVIVGLTAQTSEDKGTTGIRLVVTKANDVPSGNVTQTVTALEWGKYGLTGIRPASKGEFSELEAQRKVKLGDEIYEYLAEVGKASGTVIAKEISRPRQNVAELLKMDMRFTSVGRDGHSILYGIREKSRVPAYD